MNKLLCLIFAILICGGLHAQQVKLSRLEYAAGADSVIVSNADGKAEWKPASDIGISFGSGTNGYYPIFSGDTLANGRIYNSGGTVVIQPNPPGANTLIIGDLSLIYSGSEIRFYGATVGTPKMRRGVGSYMHTFNSDEDSGLEWLSADRIGIMAGDGSNPIVDVDGANEVLTLDANHNDTADIVISSENFATFEDVTVEVTEYAGAPMITASTVQRLYGFNGWSGGMKAISTGNIGIFGDNANNPMVYAHGGVDQVKLDADADGTYEVMSSTTMLDVATELRVGDRTSGDYNGPAGFDSDGDLIEYTRSWGQLAYNGTVALTSTAYDTLNGIVGAYAPLDAGDIVADSLNVAFVCNFDGYAEIMFNGSVDVTSAAYASSVGFALFVNDSYIAPFFASVANIDQDEEKSVTLTGIVEVSDGDELQIRYDLGAAPGSSTISLTPSIMTVKRID